MPESRVPENRVPENHVMKDPASMPEHGELTQRFIAAIVVAVIAAIVTLGLLAVR